MLTFRAAGTELVGLAGSETPNPRKTLPAAVKGTFWRIVRDDALIATCKSHSQSHSLDHHLHNLPHHYWSACPVQRAAFDRRQWRIGLALRYRPRQR